MDFIKLTPSERRDKLVELGGAHYRTAWALPEDVGTNRQRPVEREAFSRIWFKRIGWWDYEDDCPRIPLR